MGMIRELATAGLMLAVASSAGGAILGERNKARRCETSTETLWTSQYLNGENGYYVVLPKGVVAHAELPPERHQGFRVDLANTSSQLPSSRDERSMGMMSVENDSGATGLQDVADHWINLFGIGHRKFKLLKKTDVTIDAVPGIGIQASYQLARSEFVLEAAIFLKSNRVYVVSLTSPSVTYQEDQKLFQEILAGLHFTSPGSLFDDLQSSEYVPCSSLEPKTAAKPGTMN